MTLLGGGHWQQRTDVDGDGWADLPGYARGVLRPRLFWDGGNGRVVLCHGGATCENRDGGTLDGGRCRRPAAAYRRSARDATARRRRSRADALRGRVRADGARGRSHQRHDHRIRRSPRTRPAPDGVRRDRRARDRRPADVGRRRARSSTTRIDPLDRPALRATRSPCPASSCRTMSTLTRWLSVSASASARRHSEYGTFFSPRVVGAVRSGAGSAGCRPARDSSGRRR